MSAAEQVEIGTPNRGGLRLGRFIRSELAIIFGRRRNIAGLAVLAAIPIILALAVRLSGPGGGPDFITAITGNGLFVAFAALAAELPVFLPLAVAAVSGDAVAGEAHLGTLRYLLTIPAGRLRLLAVKLAGIAVFALVIVLVVATVGALIGLALFGGGDLTLLSGTQTSLAGGIGRLLLGCGYLAVQLTALGTIGLFVSTLTEQPIGATIAVLLTTVVMFILVSIEQLSWLHPWLLVQRWTAFADVLRDPIYTATIERGLLLAAAYIVVFGAAAALRFGRKDITS